MFSIFTILFGFLMISSLLLIEFSLFLIGTIPPERQTESLKSNKTLFMSLKDISSIGFVHGMVLILTALAVRWFPLSAHLWLTTAWVSPGLVCLLLIPLLGLQITKNVYQTYYSSSRVYTFMLVVGILYWVL